MKVVIGIWHSEHIAQSATIREFAKLLTGKYPLADIRWLRGSPEGNAPVPAGDFQCIMETASVKIGIDNKTVTDAHALDVLFEENCDVILCAALNDPAADRARKLALEQGYRVIWTAPYQVESKDQRLFAEMNKLKARHLLDLLTAMWF